MASARRLELFPPRGSLSRCHDETFPIGFDVERSIGVDLQKIQDSAIEHKGQTVAVFRQLLDHTRTSITGHTMY